ncbi:hypothetical protein [Puia dinghuensis]|uniref:Uncharacterized protein n=1 Tax=Puia dinghuensis TaxID=1792502 RepID=A0A8J2UE90_9BACT|nr:hypothetical protein [Puia dinghuensis]GGB04469.1 hypothetical protein GCM10011511_29720 [Puia dinghuensis]
MKHLLGLVLLVTAAQALAQTPREDIHTDFVLYNRRVALEKDLRDRVVAKHFSTPLDSNSEDGYLSGCWAVEQFLFDSPVVMQGFDHLFAGYDQLSYDTKRALLEAVYAVAPLRYQQQVGAVLAKEADARLFALCAVYLYRADRSVEHANTLKIKMVEQFPGYDTVAVLRELQDYLSFVRPKMPAIGELFAYRGATGVKTIYSFQRWHRDYPGLAIVQNADGSFVRDGNGRLQVFEQLARSGPGLPYFLTNGNTPQGVYSIQGTAVSGTNYIGPTPNLQMLLPGEGKWSAYFHDVDTAAGEAGHSATGEDSLQRYRALLPPEWRDYSPMMEAWAAGAIGRTEIIAHGTTIDPDYFKGRPFYPLTPTMGCLCAKELWNPTTGHLLVSEQNNLVNAFLSTPGQKGFLIVINVDDQQKAVSREEIETFINKNPRR